MTEALSGKDGQYANPKCYARTLGQCSKGLSREHYVTKKLLEQLSGPYRPSNLVKVSNLGFQVPGEEGTYGVSSLRGLKKGKSPVS